MPRTRSRSRRRRTRGSVLRWVAPVVAAAAVTAVVVTITAVNVMAMDYGDGPAPNPSGQLVRTDAQVASALGISDTVAWSKVALTPMIGVNDTSDEIFTVANAKQLVAFAQSKHLAWLSMCSAGRDQECPGGAADYAEVPRVPAVRTAPRSLSSVIARRTVA